MIERLHLHISFIDFYQEVISYSLTNFSRSTANYMWSTSNLFLVFNLEIDKLATSVDKTIQNFFLQILYEKRV